MRARGDGPPATHRPLYTLVYDGSCGMCSRLAERLIRWDRNRLIEVVPSQRDGVMARFPWIAPAAFREAIQLVGPGGQTWHAAAAVEQLLAVLPRGRWIAWIFRVPFARRVAEVIYRWVARHRHRLGCGTHCRTAV